MKKFWVFVLLVTVLSLAACGESDSNDKSQKSNGRQLKSADVVSAKSPYSEGMAEFYERIKDDTDGKFNVKHFPAGQLGDETEIIEGVKLGTLDFALTGSIPDAPATQAMSLPYLFEDSEHMHRVLDGEVGDKLRTKIEKDSGVTVLGYVYFAPRVLTLKGKDVKTPKDLSGLKIRTPDNPISIKTWKSLGASPTPMSFNELFSALQQGVVNGQENPFELIVSSSLYEVQDTVVETYHAMPVRYLIMNNKLYDSLTDDEKNKLVKTWKEVSMEIEEEYKAQDEEYKATLKEHGMNFIQPDIESFKEATKDVWKEIAPNAFGEGIYEEIQELR